MDDEYSVPLRVEVLGKGQIAERTLILRSFKKMGDRWIVKEIDCRDRKSRSVTRMKVISAALSLDLDESLFRPEILFNPYSSTQNFIAPPINLIFRLAWNLVSSSFVLFQ